MDTLRRQIDRNTPRILVTHVRTGDPNRFTINLDPVQEGLIVHRTMDSRENFDIIRSQSFIEACNSRQVSWAAEGVDAWDDANGTIYWPDAEDQGAKNNIAFESQTNPPSDGSPAANPVKLTPTKPPSTINAPKPSKKKIGKFQIITEILKAGKNCTLRDIMDSYKHSMELGYLTQPLIQNLTAMIWGLSESQRESAESADTILSENPEYLSLILKIEECLDKQIS